ncbi:MAG: hypothetical protein AVDCRST_MAG73-2435, partial [uncultured Thermomicrobiales bacterium]
ASLATAEAAIAAAAATIEAQATEQAVTARRVDAALNPRYVEEQITVDAAGIPAGNDDAVDDARTALRRTLLRYASDDDCRVGVALTFGHAATIGEGTVLAAAINDLAVNAAPDLFAGAAFDAFGDLNPPPGQVDLRLYFFSGCAAAED